MLGGIEPKGSEFVMVPIKDSKEAGTTAEAVAEVPQDESLEVEA